MMNKKTIILGIVILLLSTSTVGGCIRTTTGVVPYGCSMFDSSRLPKHNNFGCVCLVNWEF